MRTWSRRGWRGRLRWTGGLLASAALLFPAGVTDSAPSGTTHAAKPRIITVDTLSVTPNSTQTSLARAMALAAQDPLDNVIQFEPRILEGQSRILLDKPLVASATGGKDRIEGPAEGAGLVLDASNCPDAGVIVGDRSSLLLSRLSIIGGRQRAVLVKDKGSLQLEDVAIRSPNGPAVAMFNEARAQIVRSRIAGSKTHGVEVHGDCSVQLDQTVVAESGQSGIAGFERAHIVADHCRLDRNGHWNLVLTGQARADATDCVLTGVSFSNADAGENTRLSLKGCTLEQGKRFGLFATGQSTVQLDGGTIRNQAGRGIEAQDSARLSMQAVEVDSNRDYGAILFENCSISAVACKFTRNSGHGVSLRGKATGDFKACLFAGNRYSGLGCLDAQDGGSVAATQCIFRGNGMRPIYRGPLHLDPLVPTPISIDAETVQCAADPRATIELFFDRAGEASRYYKTVRTDAQGRFVVNRSEVPAGWVMTATATTNRSTSEFNVVAGADAPDLMGALLAHTGPLSDDGGSTDLDGGMRRWRNGTRLVMQITNPPSAAVERYAHFIADHVSDWTRGAIQAQLCLGNAAQPAGLVVVPVKYMSADSEPLLGRGGVTFMKWDNQGFFVSPMRILLATGKEPQDTCPRVLAHEFGHVLGLCHARVGLLSRMQGSMPPSDAFVNDFSPMLTYYDVLALHMLHEATWNGQGTLRQAIAAGMLSGAPRTTAVASRQPAADQPTYSPPPAQPRPEEASTPSR